MVRALVCTCLYMHLCMLACVGVCVCGCGCVRRPGSGTWQLLLADLTWRPQVVFLPISLPTSFVSEEQVGISHHQSHDNQDVMQNLFTTLLPSHSIEPLSFYLNLNHISVNVNRNTNLPMRVKRSGWLTFNWNMLRTNRCPTIWSYSPDKVQSLIQKHLFRLVWP